MRFSVVALSGFLVATFASAQSQSQSCAILAPTIAQSVKKNFTATQIDYEGELKLARTNLGIINEYFKMVEENKNLNAALKLTKPLFPGEFPEEFVRIFDEETPRALKKLQRKFSTLVCPPGFKKEFVPNYFHAFFRKDVFARKTHCVQNGGGSSSSLTHPLSEKYAFTFFELFSASFIGTFSSLPSPGTWYVKQAPLRMPLATRYKEIQDPMLEVCTRVLGYEGYRCDYFPAHPVDLSPLTLEEMVTPNLLQRTDTLKNAIEARLKELGCEGTPYNTVEAPH